MIAATTTETTTNAENLDREWRPRRYRQPSQTEGRGTVSIHGLPLDGIYRLRDLAMALDLPANRVRSLCPTAVRVISGRCYVCLRTFWESLPSVANEHREPVFVHVGIKPLPELLAGEGLPHVVDFIEAIRLLGLRGRKPLAKLLKNRMLEPVQLSDGHVIETASLRAYAVEWARREDIKAAARAGRLCESVQANFPEQTEPVVVESLDRVEPSGPGAGQTEQPAL